MELSPWVVSLLQSLGFSIVGAWAAVKILFEHRLNKAIEAQKAKYAEDLAALEGKIRQEVELHLGDQAALREYKFDARKRLYLAVGPLRFQLLLACRDLAGRISTHGRRKPYRLGMDGYYGRSTLYRVLRPIAIGELIERQVAYSDFGLDESAVDCLRFKKSVSRILSGDELVGKHPKVDWSKQVEHAYADSIVVAANALILEPKGGPARVMRIDEFNDELAKGGIGEFQPFSDLLTDFNILEKPIFWLRLIGYGNACSSFVERTGAQIGFERVDFPVSELLEAGKDNFILSNKADYERKIRDHALLNL